MINILLATWLFVAAFAFVPSPPQFWSMVFVAVLIVAFECLAFWRDNFRYLDAGLGLWLVLSIWLLPPGNEFIYFNNLLCGVMIVVLSLAAPTRIKHRPWVPSREGYQRATEEEVRDMGKAPTRQPS